MLFDTHTLSDLYDCIHNGEVEYADDTHTLTYITVPMMDRLSMLFDRHTLSDLDYCTHDE